MAEMTDETTALAALLEREFAAMHWPNVNTTNSEFIAARLIAAGVRVAPSPTEGKYERVIHAAFDVDGAWDAEDTDGAPILWHAEAGEVLADLRTAIEALGDDEPWYSVLREDDTPIRTVTTPDGQVHRPESVRAASERLGIPIGHVRDYPYRFAPFEDDYEPGVAPSPETPGLLAELNAAEAHWHKRATLAEAELERLRRTTPSPETPGLREALERTLAGYKALLGRKPVRDATETIAEAERALASPPAPGLDVALIRKALTIGQVSHDGDGWFAKEAGYEYDDAEQTFKDAHAALSEYAATPEEPKP